jgi:hypothetical protein
MRSAWNVSSGHPGVAFGPCKLLLTFSFGDPDSFVGINDRRAFGQLVQLLLVGSPAPA